MTKYNGGIAGLPNFTLTIFGFAVIRKMASPFFVVHSSPSVTYGLSLPRLKYSKIYL